MSTLPISHSKYNVRIAHFCQDPPEVMRKKTAESIMLIPESTSGLVQKFYFVFHVTKLHYSELFQNFVNGTEEQNSGLVQTFLNTVEI